MSGLLNTAISGLRVSQAGLRTSGHNISNVDTPGFSRQRTENISQPGQQAGGAGYIGSGADIQNITRIVDQFVLTQLRTDTTNYHALNSYSANLEKIDKLFADQSTGLTGGLQSFFAALQNAADDPSSTPARQLVITEAQSLSTRFNTLYDRLMDIERNVVREMEAITEQINDLAGTVANLNHAIANKSEAGNGHSPNDLLDQRDEALRQLSELVGINAVTQGNGTVNVFMGQGQALVVGTDSNRFRVTNAGDVMLGQGNRSYNVTEQLSGGQLSGLADFRGGILHTAKNELGRVSLVLSDVFNQQQLQGLDLDGDFGERMFKDINATDLTKQRVVADHNAAPDDRQLAVTIEDVNQLTASDYKFEILENTNNYVITRLDGNEVVGQGMLSGAYPERIAFDGVVITLESGSFQGGDTFTIKPTTDAARYMEARLSRPEDLALASPVRTGTHSGNEGTAEISQGEVLSMFAADGTLLPTFANAGQLSPPVVIRFTSETTYEILDNSDPSNPKPLQPPIREQFFAPGQDNALFPTDPGETRVIGNGAKLGLPDGRNAQVVTAGGMAQGNGYPVEQMRFRITDPHTGVTSTQNVVSGPNASAANLAEQLGRVPGVSANAFTEATLTDFNLEDFSSPLQITVNGENLLEYQGGALSPAVPNPQTQPGEFQEYLAERINDNPNLQALGFRAEAGANPVTGELEVRLVASSGVDMDIRLQADGAGQNQLSVNDSNGNPNVRLSGQGAGNESTVTVGGRVDLTLAEGVTLNTAPSDSQLLGDSRADGFAQSSYLGFQATIKGQPKAGDTFTLDFNNDASNDNRNGLAMAALETAKIMGNGNLDLNDAYGRLVEQVGTESASARTNTQASRSLLEQTQSMRDSISGVNLDEEAANLIRFEQAYNANSRVISIARDIFDTLLNSI